MMALIHWNHLQTNVGMGGLWPQHQSSARLKTCHLSHNHNCHLKTETQHHERLIQHLNFIVAYFDPNIALDVQTSLHNH